MKKHVQAGKAKRFFASRWFYIGGCVLILLLALGYGRAYYQAYKVRKEIESLQEQVRGLEHKRLESMSILSYVMSKDFVEEKARTELNLKKPGEHVLVVPEDGNQKERASVTSAPEAPGQRVSNPLKWWYYFFGSRSGADYASL